MQDYYKNNSKEIKNIGKVDKNKSSAIHSFFFYLSQLISRVYIYLGRVFHHLQWYIRRSFSLRKTWWPIQYKNCASTSLVQRTFVFRMFYNSVLSLLCTPYINTITLNGTQMQTTNTFSFEMLCTLKLNCKKRYVSIWNNLKKTLKKIYCF